LEEFHFNWSSFQVSASPAYEKMVTHCNFIAAKANCPAVENEKAAASYELRAKDSGNGCRRKKSQAATTSSHGKRG